MDSKMENATHRFREAPPVPQLIQESQIKSKTVVSWGSHKKKKRALFIPWKTFLTFVFYLNVYCIEYTFIVYILLHIKKH